MYTAGIGTNRSGAGTAYLNRGIQLCSPFNTRALTRLKKIFFLFK